GYTDHEHLNEQQLIHMNGRIYDFNVGRFLSVDPFLQFPENSQSANPYSYILNNPMSGVDPTGYSAIRSGNASNWRVPMCDSNYGNTCAKTPVDNIMAQWGLSNGQSNESLAKQGQLRREQARKDEAEASSASSDIDIAIDNDGLNDVSQTKLSPEQIKSRQEKARSIIKGISFSKMAGHDPLGKQKQFYEDLDAIAMTDQFYEFSQLYDGKGIHINICTNCFSQSQDRNSQGVNVIRLNLSVNVYSRAEGGNSYVAITGSRLLAHELVHAFKNHKIGNSLQNVTNEKNSLKI
ncbi:RHS repeat domain-containing protein, partial [Shewanella baltica]|uniref:RHS repeat domain-containing protein n=1 Tax=Shewanella baltica TaxID=62322 RepID=UPI00325F757F